MAAPSAARRGAALAAIGAILLAILASLYPSAAVAAFPGANGRIAYAWHREREPSLEIFTILPDGSGAQQLTANSASWEPSWSPDGQSIVFTRLGPDGGSRVFKMDADGGDQTRLAASPASLASPSFSPSGRRIVYTKFDAIVTIRADGTDPRRLVTGGALASPQYSPTGRRIAFGGGPEGKRRGGIWTVRRDGSRLRRLTDPERVASDLADRDPDYSPDGRHIVFVRASTAPHGGAIGIYLMRADGSRERSIPGTGGFTFLAYAPAGDRIVASLFEGTYLDPGGGCSDLYTISPTGSDRQRITDNCNPQGIGDDAFWPSWQPVPAVK